MMHFPVHYSRRLLLFVLLSLADLACTFLLLARGEGRVYESNPVAEWWLSSWGPAGLIVFKLGAVLLVVTLAAAIARGQPRRGAQLLNFACVVVAGVLVYSGILAARVEAHPPRRTLAGAQARTRLLDRELADRQRWRQTVERVARELLQSGNLRRATEELHAACLRQHPKLVYFLGTMGQRAPVREKLADLLLEELRGGLADGTLPTAAAVIVRHLERELKTPAFRMWCAGAPAHSQADQALHTSSVSNS